MSESLFLEERRRAILDYLKQHGRVSVKTLSRLLHVSAVTIRQDLRALEENGLLERTYGGAVLRSSTTPVTELTFEARRARSQSEKAAIAAAAAARVQNGWGIALDASTTVHAITPFLKRLQHLTIVTNSLIIAQQFLDTPTIRVILPGGRLRRDSVSLVGRPETLPDINLNIGFFGTLGLAPGPGATEISQEEADMKRAMTNRCLSVVVVADGSKWGQIAPYTYLHTSEIRQIITSRRAPVEQVALFRSSGAQIEIVDSA